MGEPRLNDYEAIAMANRPKRGIQYAGWDVDIFENDTKIDELLDAQGWVGFSIYFYLCQRAYASEGYFYRWSYANAATTARRMGGGIVSDTVRQAVASCLQIGLFNRDLFEAEGVLTSKGIQRRYAQAVQNRRVRTAYSGYWLLDEKETKAFKIVLTNENDTPTNTHLQGANTHLQDANAPKSKVENSRVKDSKSSSASKTRTPTAEQVINEQSFSPALDKAVKDWVKYKIEKRQGYKETGLRSLLTRIRGQTEQYGEEAVVNIIYESMSNNWQGIIWDRIAKGSQGGYQGDRIRNRLSEVDKW